ncbi:MAG: hypothetical protein HC880_02130 [Bacteroidia bacterium]|nr:hypothetical protein [Bacteroidia bacterium]
MPLSHNVIEAMAVGTIPILEYPEHFHPPLEHGVNAIIFQGKDDLVNKVREVLQLSAERIAILRKNVVDYYQQNLIGSAFIEKIENHSAPHLCAYMYVTELSVQAFNKS